MLRISPKMNERVTTDDYRLSIIRILLLRQCCSCDDARKPYQNEGGDGKSDA